ncbi:MAG: hypothetical protein QM790_16830 [Nibricoccus sp.]
MELKQLPEIKTLERHRVEDAGAYKDEELRSLLRLIFGLADIDGSIKKLRAKDVYLLADGSARKPMANLPTPPPSVAPAMVAPAAKLSGVAIPRKPSDNIQVTADEYAALNRKVDYAQDHPEPICRSVPVEAEPDVDVAQTPRPTAKEVELAKTPGQTPEQRAAREKVARDFYHEHPTLGDDRCDEDIRGIDLNQPVEVVEFPPPPQMGQYVRRSASAPGNFFDPIGGQSADSMGLNGDASAREYRTYTTPHGQGLKSTAAPITDTWTDANNPVVTRGGGQQIVVDKPTSAKFSRT